MGYNFACETGCTLMSNHAGPCTALSGEERMAQAILEHCYLALICVYCDSESPKHAEDCVALVASRIWNRRVANLQYFGRKD